MLENLKRLQSTLSATQLVTLAAVLVAVVGTVLGSAYWLNRPDYTLLYSDLDAESASAVVEGAAISGGSEELGIGAGSPRGRAGPRPRRRRL